MGVFLVEDQDAGGDAGAVEQVGRQADDTLDESTEDEVLADVRFPVAPEQYAVRQYDRALAPAIERRNEVKEECVVAVPGRWDTVTETVRTRRWPDRGRWTRPWRKRVDWQRRSRRS